MRSHLFAKNVANPFHAKNTWKNMLQYILEKNPRKNLAALIVITNAHHQVIWRAIKESTLLVISSAALSVTTNVQDQSGDLKKHERIHTAGDKPFSCSTCNKSCHSHRHRIWENINYNVPWRQKHPWIHFCKKSRLNLLKDFFVKSSNHHWNI